MSWLGRGSIRDDILNIWLARPGRLMNGNEGVGVEEGEDVITDCCNLPNQKRDHEETWAVAAALVTGPACINLLAYNAYSPFWLAWVTKTDRRANLSSKVIVRGAWMQKTPRAPFGIVLMIIFPLPSPSIGKNFDDLDRTELMEKVTNFAERADTGSDDDARLDPDRVERGEPIRDIMDMLENISDYLGYREDEQYLAEIMRRVRRERGRDALTSVFDIEFELKEK
ncbi:hypothetical protein OG21DRAFT_1525960 [Imleria badia]|nr:hypothetical protein OG21DRAFT_1525960 [Imleria badia]